MDSNYTVIKTTELKGSTFRTHVLDFQSFSIADYDFEAVFKNNLGQIVLRKELAKTGNVVHLDLIDLQDKTGRFSAEVWMSNSSVRDLAVLFEILITASNTGIDDDTTHNVVVTFEELSIPVSVTQGNVSINLNYDLLTEEQKAELKGDKGDKGDKGEQGLQGIQGLKGDKGDKGEQGLQGLKGDKGDTGATGANGSDGWSPLLVMDSTTIAGKSLLKLTDWTGGTGTKPTTNVGKWLKGDGTYTDVASEANDLKGVSSDNLIASYTHSANKVVQPTAIDTATATITANNHGLSNNDLVTLNFNYDVIDADPRIYLPNGLQYSVQADFRYKVVNVTQNTFQLQTSSGVSLSLTDKGTQNISKWHFERGIYNLVIDNLKNITKFRINIFGQLAYNSDAQITFNSNTPYSGWTGDVNNNANTNLGLFGSYHFISTIDVRLQNNILSMTIKTLQTAINDAGNTVITKKNEHMYIKTLNTSINRLTLMYFRPQNGLKIEIFKID